MTKGKRYNADSTSTEYRAPARQASASSDVLVPFLQSLICGITAAIVAVAFTSLRIAAVAFALVFALAWFALLFDHRRLLWSIEKITNTDIDNNGVVGAPDLGMVYVDAPKARQQAANAHATEMREAILQFVRLVDAEQQAGRRTGQRALRGKRLRPTSYTVTDEFHSKVGDMLVDNGLAIRNSDSSWTLTASVAEVEASLSV